MDNEKAQPQHILDSLNSIVDVVTKRQTYKDNVISEDVHDVISDDISEETQHILQEEVSEDTLVREFAKGKRYDLKDPKTYNAILKIIKGK